MTDLTKEEKLESLAKQPINELRMRLGMVNGAIRLCAKEGASQEVMDKYRGQAKRINAAIRAQMGGKKNGEAVKIKANVGSFTAKGSL